MTTDLTFITNEPPARRSPCLAEAVGEAQVGAGGEANFLNRFKVLTCTERSRTYQRRQIF